MKLSKDGREESKEPTITINGQVCTDAMAMTIRVALEGFAMDLKEHGLGDDVHGKTMVQLYQARIDEIRKLIFNKEKRS
jgi:hypothetical protein